MCALYIRISFSLSSALSLPSFLLFLFLSFPVHFYLPNDARNRVSRVSRRFLERVMSVPMQIFARDLLLAIKVIALVSVETKRDEAGKKYLEAFEERDERV